ncbi:MAG: 2Fe-2S iron-sulfur cluster-binding protein [Methylobacter sp.]|jgi:ferredoxin-NADP reductase/Fe-S-cluster-containing hydrogenase component 2
MDLNEHPTVKMLRARDAGEDVNAKATRTLQADWLRQLAMDCGADDAGLIDIDLPALDPQRTEILERYPWTKTLLSFVVRMSREPVRSSARSVANLEFHNTGDLVDEVSRHIVLSLEETGIRAVNPAMGFPMEMYQFPHGGAWVVSHKPVAVAAGLGHMGIHRNVIHPKFGNFILLGTVLIDAETTAQDGPLDYNPCLECKLCVATCPVGAIAPDGGFNFSACFTHNYREFMGGFTDWVEQVADSKDAMDYRKRISGPETAAMWQSLSHRANYKSAYCMAVCPAGEDVIGPYLRDRKAHLQEVVKPLQDKPEPVYVIKDSDADTFARKKCPNKTVKHVGNALQPRTIDGLLATMPLVFQPTQSRGLNATYHFTFTGAEQREATIVIRDRTLRIQKGLMGTPDLHVAADTRTWLGFLAKERNLAWALVRRKIRLKGSPRLLVAFGKCFPSAGVRHEPTEIVPQTSTLQREPVLYRQNDAATGKIKWQGMLTVSEISEVAHQVKTFRLVNPAGGEIPFQYLPGQFLTLDIEPRGIPTRRSYTIASTPTWRDRIEITVKREEHGLVSGWLHDELKPGDSLKLLAPNGTFIFTGDNAPSIVLIGGGVGMTPLMSVARYLTDSQWPGNIHMLLSFREPGDYLFREEVASLQSRNPNLKVTVTLSNPGEEPWLGPTGRIDKAFLERTIPNPADQRVHLCGPPPMMDAVKAALSDLGVPTSQIKTEAFGTIKRDPTAVGAHTGAVAGRIQFQRSQVGAAALEGTTILDTADEADVYIDSACRSGTCGLCRVKLLSGKVHMAVEDALTEDEKTDGYILACQAEVETDVEIDA